MNIELPLDGKQRTLVRPLSKALFHSDFALESFLLISREDRFYGGQLAEVSGCKPNYAGQFLRRLEGEGLVERLPQEPGQVRQYFRRVPSPIWDSLASMVEGLLDQPQSTVTRLPSR